jgi:serine/threonine protein kinase
VLLTKDVQNQSFVVETSLNVNQELSIEVANSSQSKVFYGSACEFLWYELLAKDIQEDVQVDVVESFLEVQRLDPLEVHLGEEIAEGGETHIYFASRRKFNTPVVFKVFKRHLNLLQLQRQMEKVMRVARKRSSAICRVMGVGDHYAGKPWVLMEHMGGDLRDLLDTGMHYVKDGQMPFHYTATIKMMMEIAQGMEDLHRCGLIHKDLKASNIFVTPLMLGSFANGLEQALVLIYFYIKIGDYESLDGVIGTGFWRPPEVLHALKDGVVVPIPIPAGDVYTFGMLFL